MPKKRLPPGYTQRKDGYISAAFTVEGKRYYVYGKTISECREKEIAKRAEIEKGSYRRIFTATISEYFEAWEVNRHQEVRESTIRKQHFEFQTMCKQVIDSNGTTFGEVKVTDITKQMCLDLRGELLKFKKVNSTNQSIALLKYVLDDAIESKVITENPARTIKALKVPRKEKDSFTVHRGLTKDEAAAFLKAAESSHYYNMFVFLMYSGTRHGEAGALTFGDIGADTVEIHNTLTKNESGAYVPGDETKTDAGTRTIPLLSEAKKALLDQRRQCMQDGERTRIVKDSEHVFLSPEGRLCDVTDTNREIGRICKRAGIDRFTCHAFRDTFATRWVESGGDYKTLSEILGHENITTTMNTYAKVLEDTKVTEIKKVKFM